MQKPCGYPTTIFQKVDSKFLCVYCDHVLKNPIQSYCGHRFCRECIEYIITYDDSRICPTCAVEGGESEYASLTIEQTFPDNAIKREFNSMKAVCPFENCPWSGSFKDFETHYITCEHRELECQCGAKYPLTRQRHHLLNECRLRKVNCPHCNAIIIFKELDEHNNQCPLYPIQCRICNESIRRTEFQSHESRHGEITGGNCTACGKTITEENATKHFENDVDGHLIILAQRMIELEKDLGLTPSSSSRQESLANRVSRVENKLQSLRLGQQQGAIELKSGSTTAATSGGGIATGAAAADPGIQQGPSIEELEKAIKVLNIAVENITVRMEDMERQRRLNRGQLEAMESKLKQLERALALKDATISELDLRINALEQTSHDGTLLWRITEFSRRRQEAVSGRTTSIYSPAFYTSKTGYKMCARLYLNGDGAGKGTHVSLFFVVMRGQYDALLKWPFRQKVTLMFLEQSGKEHVVDAFRSDPTSSSFKRPTTEMNIASGCPLFMPLSKLESPTHSFVKDNTAFLKIIVSSENVT